MYTCSECGKNFTRLDNLRRHARNICKIELESTSQAKKIKLDSSPETLPKTVFRPPTQEHYNIEQTQRWCKTYQQRYSDAELSDPDLVHQLHISTLKTVSATSNKMCLRLKKRSFEYLYRALKVNMKVFAKYVLQTKDVVDITSSNTTNKVIDDKVDLPVVYKHFTDEIISQLSEFEKKDSGKLFR
ncbi:unnamed protein product [Acanthoscelides obtectus]|uniref:C2H2-type domain-containing protein n=1 Tax=Acanthoscelides obtectus TaxID=200917 RepID=A0A9P0MA28_ACAOB|nr:unnamed protein product [Acanthoscelides obtectus]CAK1624241.1 hypothetical protein AOBTE_LOCUS2434 [Acanthoscelides obtectus]